MCADMGEYLIYISHVHGEHVQENRRVKVSESDGV